MSRYRRQLRQALADNERQKRQRQYRLALADLRVTALDEAGRPAGPPISGIASAVMTIGPVTP